MLKNFEPMSTLNECPLGKKAIIKEISGGYGLKKKLDAMGLRIGKEIEKTSKQWGRGPVTIKFGNTEIAVGHGMAKKILIEKIKP
jgi:ferrous iron transport protein A